jgi:DNA polymerase III gamma/tau subunit
MNTRRTLISDTPAVVRNKPNGLWCSACLQTGLEEPQVDSPSGPTCKFGHGGADGIMPRREGHSALRVNTGTGELEKFDPNPKSAKDEPFHLKYRPNSLDTVLGQDEVIRSLEALLKASTIPHAFLFTGPSGTGKTTLGRIVAKAVDCEPNNIVETDAATNTGIDAMRAITESLRYMGFGSKPNKVIIIDEAHALTKNAWTSLLKSVEEPPEHVWWVFCTTDENKVPENIKTRCVCYSLRPLRYGDLEALVMFVAQEEQLQLGEDILRLVVQEANGSPRKALVDLAKVRACRNADEARRLLEATQDEAEVIELARALVQGQLTWPKAQDLLRRLKEQNPEAVRITIVNYLSACILGAKKEAEVPRLLDMLEAFSRPTVVSDKLASILLAVGLFVFPPQPR